MERICRLVAHVDQVARGIGITERHNLDELAGLGVRALAAGKSDIQIHETIRLAAKKMAAESDAHHAIAQMIENINRSGNPLCVHHAG